jgi:hypothetical protein
MTPRSPIDVSFGGIYCLHLQGRRYAKQATVNQQAYLKIEVKIEDILTLQAQHYKTDFTNAVTRWYECTSHIQLMGLQQIMYGVL